MPRKYDKEYKRNRNRIKSAIRRLEKRGYVVPENVLPPVPKKITKNSVNRLERITLDKIYKSSTYVDRETGEIARGKEGRQLEKDTRVKPQKALPQTQTIPKFNDIAISNFEEMMDSIFLPRFRAYIKVWLKGLIDKVGRDGAAKILEEGATQGLWPGYEAVSDMDLIQGKLAAMTGLIEDNVYDKAYDVDMQEVLEESEDWEYLDNEDNPFYS